MMFNSSLHSCSTSFISIKYFYIVGLLPVLIGLLIWVLPPSVLFCTRQTANPGLFVTVVIKVTQYIPNGLDMSWTPFKLLCSEFLTPSLPKEIAKWVKWETIFQWYENYTLQSRTKEHIYYILYPCISRSYQKLPLKIWLNIVHCLLNLHISCCRIIMF